MTTIKSNGIITWYSSTLGDIRIVSRNFDKNTMRIEVTPQFLKALTEFLRYSDRSGYTWTNFEHRVDLIHKRFDVYQKKAGNYLLSVRLNIGLKDLMYLYTNIGLVYISQSWANDDSIYSCSVDQAFSVFSKHYANKNNI